VTLFAVGIVCFIYHELRAEHPLIDLRVLGERNLATACVILFSAFAVLYMASIAVPAMLQALFGYDALRAGLVLSPSGFSSIAVMVVAGFLLGRGTDARWLIATGLCVLAVSNYWMSQLNLEIGPWQVVWPRMVLTAGLGFIFAPINVAAYLYTPRALRGSAIALLSLLRNEGGSVGTSMVQTIQERRDQFHV
jgi:DHA2 family multidrug resistance protein